MKKVELILSLIITASVFMNSFLIPFASPLMIISMCSLALLYMFASFFIFNEISLNNLSKPEPFKGITIPKAIGTIGLGFSLAITLIGILFTMMFWPGAKQNLMMGLVFLIIILLIALTRYFKTNASSYVSMFKRIGIIGALGSVLFLLPNYAVLEFKYRNYPEYVKAVKMRDADPGNKALEDLVQQERREIYKSK